MLTTRSTKRDRSTFFNTDLLFDILDEGKPIGTLVYDKKKYAAAIGLNGRDYTVARSEDRHDERLYEALIRVMSGGEKPPANPWALRDSAGRSLALGERMKQTFAVSRGGESFTLRKLKRPFHLFREGSGESLGSVGQEKFFTRTLHMNLPRPEFDEAFQVFLLTLVLSLAMQDLENASS
ncbi:MAG: hypothetical protein JOY64_28730 [Alphaproteobacteria bacterium]|nr:hypothetical protein [Alphaproteobacteria bacterium]MBV8411647.1 hypothetical protein [Alphaproteobacteria bacterium]